MKLDKILFALILAMNLVVVVAALLPEPENPGGFAHPEFSSMRQGGSGERRQDIETVMDI